MRGRAPAGWHWAEVRARRARPAVGMRVQVLCISSESITRVTVGHVIKILSTGVKMAGYEMVDQQMVIDQEIESLLGDDILRLTTDEINSRSRLLDNEIQRMKGELNRLKFQSKDLSEKIKENNDKIKLNKQLPYLVGNVVEVYMDVRNMWLFVTSTRIFSYSFVFGMTMILLMGSTKAPATNLVCWNLDS